MDFVIKGHVLIRIYVFVYSLNISLVFVFKVETFKCNVGDLTLH